MATHVPNRPSVKTLVEAEAISKALSRMAHELIERNGARSDNGELSDGELDRVALVGVQTRGVPLAARLRRLIAERSDVELPFGAIDITFHRDDAHVREGGRSPDRQPVVRGVGLADPLCAAGRL